MDHYQVIRNLVLSLKLIYGTQEVKLSSGFQKDCFCSEFFHKKDLFYLYVSLFHQRELNSMVWSNTFPEQPLLGGQ